MGNSLKSYRSIGFRALMSWLKIFTSGFLFSVICIIIFIRLFLQENTSSPCLIIFLIVSVVCIFLYALCANKYALQRLVNQVWNNKLANFIIPKIYSYTELLTNKQPNWMKQFAGSQLSEALLDIMSQDGTLNKVQRLVMKFGLRGLKLKKKEVEKQENEPLYLSTVISGKIEKKIAELTTPSLFLFWILLAIQLILLILAIALFI